MSENYEMKSLSVAEATEYRAKCARQSCGELNPKKLTKQKMQVAEIPIMESKNGCNECGHVMGAEIPIADFTNSCVECLYTIACKAAYSATRYLLIKRKRFDKSLWKISNDFGRLKKILADTISSDAIDDDADETVDTVDHEPIVYDTTDNAAADLVQIAILVLLEFKADPEEAFRGSFPKESLDTEITSRTAFLAACKKVHHAIYHNHSKVSEDINEDCLLTMNDGKASVEFIATTREAIDKIESAVKAKSKRQHEVLGHMKHDRSNVDIAKRMKITESAVSQHKQNIRVAAGAIYPAGMREIL